MYTKELIEEMHHKYVMPKGRNRLYFLLTTDVTGMPDEIVHSSKFYRVLSSLMIDPQDWYDTHVLGVSSRSDRPKCPYPGCMNNCSFSISYGYSLGCCRSHSIHVSALNSWQDPIAIANRSEAKQRFLNSEAGVQSRIDTSNRMQKYWSDPKNVQAQSDRIHQAWLDGYYDTDEYREARSRATMNQIARGDFAVPSQHASGHIEVLKCNKSIIHYRSSYEFDYIKKLESDSSVISYEWEPFAIPYECEGPHHYLPDVLVHYSDRSELQEIKPTSLVDYGINPIKFAAATEYCKDKPYTFRVITEQDIYNSPEI